MQMEIKSPLHLNVLLQKFAAQGEVSVGVLWFLNLISVTMSNQQL